MASQEDKEQSSELSDRNFYFFVHVDCSAFKSRIYFSQPTTFFSDEYRIMDRSKKM